MKRKFIIISLLSILLCSMCFVFSGCYRDRMLKYYGNDSNYEKVNGIYREIKPSKNSGKVYIYLEYEENGKIVCYDFRIIPANNVILIDNGFYDEVQIGDEIWFTAAFTVFGDGYVVPIVEIWYGDKCYLDFETGKQNLLKYVEQTELF